MNYLQISRPYQPMNQVLALTALGTLVLSVVIMLILGPTKFVKSADELFFGPSIKAVPTIITTINPNEVAIEHRSADLTQLLHRHWENSLLAVEKVNVKNVTILEFHPDFANEKIVLKGEAKEFDALATYIKQLNGMGLVHHMELMHEQAVSHEHVDTIEFELKGDL